jgi:Tfp pilus assembly protein PilV
MMIKFKGQGLIEVLATFLIIAGSVSALIYFQNNLAYSNNLTQQKNTAMTLAYSQIETMRDFVNLTGTGSYQNIASSTSTSAGISTTYTITSTITTNTDPNYKTIDVTVSWTDRRNTAQSIRLISRVAGINPVYSGVIME